MPSNLSHLERNAVRTLSSKGLMAVPSDKGGDLCVIKKTDYDTAVSLHLENNPIYRRVSKFEVTKLDSRINEIWSTVCKDNKVPKRVQNMYTSSCSKFASIHAVVKTHKSSLENIVIRPIINSIDSPGYSLSRFLQQIIQPLVVVVSSQLIIEEIKKLDRCLLSESNFPFSLDVENMFHSIPRKQSIDLLYQKLDGDKINTPIPHSDVVKLVSVCLDCNHFVYNNKIFFQKDGLPMGNRLSGVLADLFIQKVVDETMQSSISRPPLFRYVDDLLIFGKNDADAKATLDVFNSNIHGIRFTLELPDRKVLPYLDFKVSVSPSGEPVFEFYRKPMRKEISINASSAFPKKSMENVICSELRRIGDRCSDTHVASRYQKDFISILQKNGHDPKKIRSFKGNYNRRSQVRSTSEKFFLNIPFVNDETDRKIRKSLSELGVKIHIAHKGKKLKHHFKGISTAAVCTLVNCKLNNNLCMRKGVVYNLKCSLCNSTYIGSSWRHLHIRYKEHLTHKASAIYNHLLTCNGSMIVSVLASDHNVQRMRMKEALLINELKPSLNTKNELFGSHILFDF
jgi:hypothetical protein